MTWEQALVWYIVPAGIGLLLGIAGLSASRYIP